MYRDVVSVPLRCGPVRSVPVGSEPSHGVVAVVVGWVVVESPGVVEPLGLVESICLANFDRRKNQR